VESRALPEIEIMKRRPIERKEGVTQRPPLMLSEDSPPADREQTCCRQLELSQEDSRASGKVKVSTHLMPLYKGQALTGRRRDPLDYCSQKSWIPDSPELAQ
jgi:hypothetical protein